MSELGHKTTMATPPQPPRMAVSASTNTSFAQNGASNESVYARPRASASTSALQPNAAARRASVLVAEQAKQQQQQRVQAQPQGKFGASVFLFIVSHVSLTIPNPSPHLLGVSYPACETSGQDDPFCLQRLLFLFIFLQLLRGFRL